MNNLCPRLAAARQQMFDIFVRDVKMNNKTDTVQTRIQHIYPVFLEDGHHLAGR